MPAEQSFISVSSRIARAYGATFTLPAVFLSALFIGTSVFQNAFYVFHFRRLIRRMVGFENIVIPNAVEFGTRQVERRPPRLYFTRNQPDLPPPCIFVLRTIRLPVRKSRRRAQKELTRQQLRRLQARFLTKKFPFLSSVFRVQSEIQHGYSTFIGGFIN